MHDYFFRCACKKKKTDVCMCVEYINYNYFRHTVHIMIDGLIDATKE